MFVTPTVTKMSSTATTAAMTTVLTDRLPALQGKVRMVSARTQPSAWGLHLDIRALALLLAALLVPGE